MLLLTGGLVKFATTVELVLDTETAAGAGAVAGTEAGAEATGEPPAGQVTLIRKQTNYCGLSVK